MSVPVEKENLKLWAKLCVSLWPSHTEEEMAAEWEDGGHPDEFLYMDGKEAAAFLSLSIRRDYVEGAEFSPTGYLEGIYVKPEYRRKGIAKTLVAFAKEWCREKGCREFASDCELDHTQSARFHESVGFREENRIICNIMKL